MASYNNDRYKSPNFRLEKKSEIHRKPHLFLSHSSKNKSFVHRIAKDLGILEIDVWVDDWELRIGDSLFDGLSKAIELSKYVGVILSKEFINSEWANSELKQAFSREIREKRNVIIPMIYDEVKVPPFIEDKIYLDFRKGYYEGISLLAGMVHNLSVRGIKEGIENIKPESINECIEVLRFVGFEPYIMVEKQIFIEILNAGGILYKENKVRFNPDQILRSKLISRRTAEYVKRAKRAWTDTITDYSFESIQNPPVFEARIDSRQLQPQKAYLKKLLSDNKIKEAFNKLDSMFSYNSDIQSQIIVIHNQYNKLEKEIILGIISSEEKEKNHNKIVYALTQIIEKI